MKANTTLVILAGLTAGVVCVPAQQEIRERRIQVEKFVVAAPGSPGAGVAAVGPGEDVTFEFVSSEMSFEGKVVKGAPYSADAVTETTQVLPDGNRISRKNTATLYRDSDGRTRREQTLAAVGPWAASGDPPQMIFINDPVAGVNYVLEPRNHTARKIDVSNKLMAKVKAEAEASREGVVPFHAELHAEPLPARQNAQFRNESLGKQMIEGVQAEGTRTVRTIPAGEIGNERPIEVVSERWYSPELQTIVMTKRNDPRTGESVYRLSNIRRAEPPRSLFEAPSDYTVKEEGAFRFERRIEK